jgi:prolyl-tRNA editing enzyme YbaK/EbsC (Cys-tRNA(Pro) deacylase)
MLTGQDLQQFINQNQIAAEILPMAEDTPTVPDAARALKVAEEQIIKSLVFLVDGQPTLVITNGTRKVDDRLIARHFGIGRKRVKMARPEQALEITGYVVGAMPPFGHNTRLPAILDPGVAPPPKGTYRHSEIFGGGGEINAMLRLTPEELLRVTEGEVVSVS